jgi:hypothetical protein
MDERDWLAERFEEHRTHLRRLPTACWARRPSTRSLRPRVVFAFTIVRGQIVQIELLAQRARLRELDLAVLGD